MLYNIGNKQDKTQTNSYYDIRENTINIFD